MKWMVGLAVVLVGGLAFAQTEAGMESTPVVPAAGMDATAVAAGEAPIRISDSEATVIVQTINGFMQGALRRGRLEILDRKKGELVKLRLDRIVTDDPERVAFIDDTHVAICGECTQMAMVEDGKGQKTEQEAGDKYEVWFVVQRGSLVSARVVDTYVKSVNGTPMYQWTRDEAGKLSATLVPDPD